VSERALEVLLYTIGCCDEVLITVCSSLKPSTDEEHTGLPEPSAAQNRIAQRDLAISVLDERLEVLKLLDQSAMNNRSLELDAEVRSLALPDEGAASKVLRYETHLDRQLYRAMDQLERLQRRRRGENVPPPLNINLGRHGLFAKQRH
jgi:hypothetical protein